MVRSLVVIGSGIAGLFAALTARRQGVRDVVIVTKAALEESATRYAQGGIAAAIGDGDSAALHEADTLGAGAELCDPGAVRVLAGEAADRVADLIRLGVRFDTENGRFAHAREGAHSMARVLHAGGDATGRYIEQALARAVHRQGVSVRDSTFVSDLIVDAGECRGVRLASGEAIEAEAVVLAAGGAGQLYSRTTNPAISTGDGVALALRAGAVVADLEFFQFHPTAFAGPGASRFLISEAVRGHGAVLRNHRGEAFMKRYDKRAELAARDIVARSIVQEMQRHDLANVWLDATRWSPGDFARRFPTIHAFCMEPRVRPGARADPRGSCGALHDGRGVDRRLGQNVRPGPLRVRRNREHRGSRRQSAGQQLAPRRRRVRGPRCPGPRRDLPCRASVPGTRRYGGAHARRRGR